MDSEVTQRGGRWVVISLRDWIVRASHSKKVIKKMQFKSIVRVILRPIHVEFIYS